MRRDGFRFPGSIFALALAVRLAAMWLAFDPALTFDKFLLLAQRLIDNGWTVREPWAFSPAYTLFVACVLRLGGSATAATAIQVTLGALACVLVAALADRLFGRPAAWLAGIGAAIYGPFLLASIELESDGVGLLLFLGAALAMARALDRPSAARLLLAGGLVGLRMAHRPDAALLLLALPAALLLFDRRHVTRALLIVPAALLVVAPITWQNWKTSGEWIPVTSSGGWVFYTSHNWQARGLSYFPPPLAWQWMNAPTADPFDHLDDRVSGRLAALAGGRALSPATAARFWKREGIASMRRRGVAGQATLQAKRLLYMLHGYEGHDDLPLLLKQERLGAFASGMGVLAPFAVLGLLLSFSIAGLWRRHGAWLMPCLALPVVSMSLFYVGARFRLEWAALLLPFAAVAIVALWGAVVSGRRAVAVRYAVVVVLLGLLFNLADGEIARQRRLRFIQVRTFAGERLLPGQAGRAEGEFLRAVEAAATPAEAEAAWRGLAAALAARGDQDAARRAEETARGLLDAATLARLRERPDDPDALWAVARHHLVLGQPEAAAEALRRAVALAPEDPDLEFALASAAFDAGGTPAGAILARVDEAFAKGLRFSTNAAAGRVLEGRLALMLGREEEARRAFETALRYDPENDVARRLLSDTSRSGSRPG